MAVTAIDVTAGGASANSYVTLAVANQYHEDRPAVGTTWSAATDAVKNAAILWATKLLDQHFDWKGSVISDTQALGWPRSGLATMNGYNLDSATIPTEVQEATAEYARQLIAEDRAGDSDIETQGITHLKAGPITLGFSDNVVAKNVPDVVVWMMPRHWFRLRGTTGVHKLVRA